MGNKQNVCRGNVRSGGWQHRCGETVEKEVPRPGYKMAVNTGSSEVYLNFRLRHEAT